MVILKSVVQKSVSDSIDGSGMCSFATYVVDNKMDISEINKLQSLIWV